MNDHDCQYKETIIEMRDDIKDIKKRLFVGNGSKALVERTALTEAVVARHEKLLWFIGTTVTGSLISSVMGLVLK